MVSTMSLSNLSRSISSGQSASSAGGSAGTNNMDKISKLMSEKAQLQAQLSNSQNQSGGQPVQGQQGTQEGSNNGGGGSNTQGLDMAIAAKKEYAKECYNAVAGPQNQDHLPGSGLNEAYKKTGEIMANWALGRCAGGPGSSVAEMEAKKASMQSSGGGGGQGDQQANGSNNSNNSSNQGQDTQGIQNRINQIDQQILALTQGQNGNSNQNKSDELANRVSQMRG